MDAVAASSGMGPGGDSRRRAGERVVLELDLSPRLTAPNPRVDSIRGCLAVERGPIVYCFEQADLPAGTELADVTLDPAAEPSDAGRLEELGGVPVVAVAGAISKPNGWQHTAYRDARSLSAEAESSPTELVAVPYFTWANREPGAMRVWTPVAPRLERGRAGTQNSAGNEKEQVDGGHNRA